MPNFIIFFKEILAGKTRLFLTTLAIAWATATITFMLAVGEGLRVTWGKTNTSIGKNFIVVTGGQTASTKEGQTPNQWVQLTQQDIDKITQGIPGINVVPEYQSMSEISYRGQSSQNHINAVYPNYGFFRNLNIQPGGRFIDKVDIQQNRRVVVIGSHFAREVLPQRHANQLVGQTLTIDQKPYTIIGMLEEKPDIGFYQMPDNYLAWIPASTYIVEKKPQEINTLLIFSKEKSKSSHLKKQLVKLIAAAHHLDPEDENILQIMDIKEMQEKAQSVLQGTEIFLGIVGTMTLAIAGVGVANVMFISVRRATREIGIRMALGARSWQILWRYIAESLTTTFAGGAVGITVAYLLVYGVNQIPLENEMFKYIGKPTPIFSFSIVSIIVSTLGLVGLLAGFFPARRAATINPAEALRHE